MEGLAITPDGKALVGIMQGPLLQDASRKETTSLLRIVKIDIASGMSKEYGYKLTAGSAVSDIVAINNDQFLVLERDGKGLGNKSDAEVKQLFKIDLGNAKEITDSSRAAAAKAAVKKTLFLDIVAALGKRNFESNAIPEKIEGVAFGQDVMVEGVRKHTLYIVNDNDFVSGKAGQNQIFVFGFQDGDLPDYMPQQFFDENQNKK
jgi:hypothetical protein